MTKIKKRRYKNTKENVTTDSNIQFIKQKSKNIKTDK